ncbi:hypothetical protein FRAAL2594 [Frankia alni ACN14a]|uniref:Uncharacterized protein n=1 Tax=Frankia alni (strain DSM 45986 / CECT 9034 / ACN14a) TaxID=326424 RepID=Q0RAL9_FRAAA|nr:hypothetical protein FRAAL2594 [Frankia alni ACN14a]
MLPCLCAGPREPGKAAGAWEDSREPAMCFLLAAVGHHAILVAEQAG